MSRQYEFKDGHFIDAWNEGVNDEQLMVMSTVDDVWPWHESVLTMCGCGSPDVVVEAMAQYLERVEVKLALDSPDQIRRGTPDFVADYLIASMADDLRFTEHGGGIYNCWLDDAGRRWLELYREGR